MRKTSEAQLRAVRKYDATRPKRPVSFRLDEDEMAQLDRARGERSRADYALSLVLDAVRR
jgi:hypothetical protein